MFILISSLILSLLSFNSSYAGGFSTATEVPYRYSNFRTIVTKHFDIHYPARSSEDYFIPENMERMAKLTAVYMEDAFSKLSIDLNSAPYLRIQVVLVDISDSHNGFATPVPQNIIYIYTIPPLPHSSISEYDNWLRDTCFHELTHIINLSTTRGYSVGLRAIFGTVVDMNGMSPSNLIEGYAVFEETNMTSKGRGRSTFLNTMLRVSASEDKLNDKGIYELSKMPYVLDEWPMGNRPYLYGYLIFEHVALKYGLDVPGKISKHNAGVVPYYPSYSFEKFTGKNISALWQDTLADKNVFYNNWISEIKKDKVTPVEEKVGNGFINRMPAESPDGKHLAYYSVNPDKRNAIVIIDAATGKELHRRRTDDASFIKWLDNDTVIFNRFENEVFGNFYDVKTYDLKKIFVRTIGNSYRILYLDVIDPKTFCTVRAKTGMATLALEEIKNGDLTPLKTLYSTELLSRIASPNCLRTDKGIKAYFIEKKTDKNEEIMELDESGNVHSLYSSDGNIKDIKLSKDRKSLILIDDKDGVFNIYRLDLAKHSTSKVTNLISGAFDVATSSSDDKLYITYYSSSGFKIGTIPAEEKHKDVPRPKLMTLPLRNTASPNIEDLEDKSYSPLKTLVPKFWIPTFTFVEKGFTAGGMTYGSDALFRHQYFAEGMYDSRTKKPLIGLSYTNQSFYPIFSAAIYNDNTWFAEDQIIENLNSEISMAIPLNTSWLAFTGVAYNYRKLDFMGERSRRFGMFWGIGYDETSTTMSAISSAEEGTAGYLRYTLYPKGMSTYQEYEIDSQISFFVPLWWDHHVLAFNNTGAYTYGNPDMFYLVGGEASSLIFGSKSLLMRGYPISYYATRAVYISNIEYRFPIWTINRGPGLAPIFFRKIHGAIIMDNGFLGKNLRVDLHSFGFELRTDGNILYHVPVTLRLGLYKATDIPNAQLFVGISSVF